MSDYLSRIVTRNLEVIDRLEPRRPSAFEPYELAPLTDAGSLEEPTRAQRLDDQLIVEVPFDHHPSTRSSAVPAAERPSASPPHAWSARNASHAERRAKAPTASDSPASPPAPLRSPPVVPLDAVPATRQLNSPAPTERTTASAFELSTARAPSSTPIPGNRRKPVAPPTDDVAVEGTPTATAGSAAGATPHDVTAVSVRIAARRAGLSSAASAFASAVDAARPTKRVKSAVSDDDVSIVARSASPDIVVPDAPVARVDPVHDVAPARSEDASAVEPLYTDRRPGTTRERTDHRDERPAHTLPGTTPLEVVTLSRRSGMDDEDIRHRAGVSTPVPTIHVTIGRIEVKAIPAPAPARQKSAPASAPSLNEYLRHRAEGTRR